MCAWSCASRDRDCERWGEFLKEQAEISHVSFEFGTGFVATFTAELKDSWSLTWGTETQTSTTNINGSTASLSVQGPPCNNVVLQQGPCVPQYDASGMQPTQFDIYQDNLYGTFMFAPVHYY
jgi:hypothetical protein